MKHNEPISHIMQKELVTVHKGMALSEVRKTLLEKNIHHLPVVEGDEIIGLISNTDIMRVSVADAFGQDQKQSDAYLDHQLSIEKVMVTNIKTIHEDETVRDATALLANGDFHSLPVVDKDKKLVGIVTTTDLLKYFLEKY